MSPISELPDLIGAFEETIATEKNERRRLNGLVRVVEDYCAGVSDDFLGQFGESSQKYTRHLLHAELRIVSHFWLWFGNRDREHRFMTTLPGV